jgi:hypothetical protein
MSNDDSLSIWLHENGYIKEETEYEADANLAITTGYCLIRTRVTLPSKPIQLRAPSGIRPTCVECNLVHEDEYPPFHHHHIYPLSVIPWYIWNKLEEERKHETKSLCPWCHAAEHDKMDDEVGARTVAGWLRYWVRKAE